MKTSFPCTCNLVIVLSLFKVEHRYTILWTYTDRVGMKNCRVAITRMHMLKSFLPDSGCQMSFIEMG